MFVNSYSYPHSNMHMHLQYLRMYRRTYLRMLCACASCLYALGAYADARELKCAHVRAYVCLRAVLRILAGACV
jgi:hypothetical protein